MKNKFHYFLLVSIIALDQFTKLAIKSNMQLKESIAVIDGIFHITYIRNYGAAFSILDGKRGFLLVLTGILILILLGFMIFNRKYRHPLLLSSLACIIAGGLGNLIDRALMGYVVDFLDFRIWPIFNVADIGVCVGCALLIIYVIFFDNKNEHNIQNLQIDDSAKDSIKER